MSMASTECCIRNILYSKEWNYVCNIVGYRVNFIRTDRQIWLILAGPAYALGLRVHSMVFIYSKYKYICLITINIVETNFKGLRCKTCPISNFLLLIQFAIMQLHNLWGQLCPFDDVVVYYQMLFYLFFIAY